MYITIEGTIYLIVFMGKVRKYKDMRGKIEVDLVVVGKAI